MDTAQKIADAKVAAEDMVHDLERIMLRARASVIRKPGREIHEASPELFEIHYLLAKAHATAANTKAELLQVIGMHPDTTFVRSLERR